MKLYWDYANLCLLTALDPAKPMGRLAWVLRDKVPVDIYLVNDNGSGAYAAVAVPAGLAIKFGANTEASLAEPLLIDAPSWTPSGTKNSASVDLSSAALISAIGTEETLDLIGEVTLQAEDGSQEYSTQFNLRIHADVYHGSETPP